MDIRVEVCKDTYVTSCTPAPPVDLPECEHGWELGNGTAVCATEQPPSAPLAATGGDLGVAVGGGALAAALLCAGVALAIRARRKRREHDVPD